jgi:signal transduction histidine kinase
MEACRDASADGEPGTLKPDDMNRTSDRLEPQDPDLPDKILNLLRILSHDVRGSLVSMSATLKLLSRGYYGKVDEDVANRLNELLSKTTGLIGTTEEYLSFAFSLNSDRNKESEVWDLAPDIVDPVLEELAPEIKSHQILIDNRLDGLSAKKIPIQGDKVWWKAIFRNLLRNAIRYGDQGGTIVLDVEIHGSFCRLNVFNTGKPVPAEYRDKLFTRFMGIGTRNNENLPGMGLGLSLVKKIIRKQGGDIWYEAKENGSNFVFTLPINGVRGTSR